MRFRKSVKVMPGVRLNLSKTGVSTSIGGRGATVNIGKHGVRSTLSVPGTGLSWSKTKGWSEVQRASPESEIEYLRDTASSTLKIALKEAQKVNAVGARIDRAIDTLNGGRGLTPSKAQTFEKRVLTEAEKLERVRENIQENILFLNAIATRLQGMKFGFFGGGHKRRRDQIADAVLECARETKGLEEQVRDAHRALLEKLEEVRDRLENGDAEKP